MDNYCKKLFKNLPFDYDKAELLLFFENAIWRVWDRNKEAWITEAVIEKTWKFQFKYGRMNNSSVTRGYCNCCDDVEYGGRKNARKNEKDVDDSCRCIPDI